MEDMSAFEIATIIPIALFCFIFVVLFIVAFVSETVEFFKRLTGKSFKEHLKEQLTEIEQKVSDLTIETECNSDNFETLREHFVELDEQLNELSKELKQLNEHVKNCYF